MKMYMVHIYKKKYIYIYIYIYIYVYVKHICVYEKQHRIIIFTYLRTIKKYFLISEQHRLSCDAKYAEIASTCNKHGF